MRGQAAGNRRENQVAAIMRAEGWLIGSMRQSAGGGDLLAVIRLASSAFPHDDRKVPTWPARNATVPLVYLVEVKSTADGPWKTFGPADRRAMLDRAHDAGGHAWLAWWPPKGKLTWIPAKDWPATP